MPVVPTLDVEKYLDFKTMTHYLKAVSSAAPHLVRVFSIGKSRVGRPLLVAEVTNRNLREGREKPGLWVDGGHQGWNLLGSMASLELLRFLVAGHGRDEFITDLIDHNVFYIAPRLAPDEMEKCLETGVILPQKTDNQKNHSHEGRLFRTIDPHGGWKPCKRDNRLLVPRNPEDRKGPFYDLYRHLDSERLAEVGPNDFPCRTAGHGPSEIPLQLPSTRAVFEFMRSYSNVFGVISTTGPGDRIQRVTSHASELPNKNLETRLAELAGLPLSPPRLRDHSRGDFLSWTSQSLGVISIDCQMWSLRDAASLKQSDLEDPLGADEAELLHLMRFCEKEFSEKSFLEWTTHVDPILGKGEIGGWDWSQTWLNPPTGPYLSRELKKLSRLALGLAAASPRLSIETINESVVGWSDDSQPLRKLDVSVRNSGYLPTCPLETQSDKFATVTLNVDPNNLLMGTAVSDLEELSGTADTWVEDGLPSIHPKGLIPLSKVAKFQYLIKGSATVELVVSHPMGGVHAASSKPPQGLRPPSFDTGYPSVSLPEPQEENDDPFEEAFPSFEELYNEPTISEPVAPASPERRPIPEPPPPPQPRIPQIDPSNDFGIPDPTPPGAEPGSIRAVQFGTLESPQTQTKGSPFPSNKPSKGRVFGSPPQKPGGGLPMGLGAEASSLRSETEPSSSRSSESDFSPLPLVGTSQTSTSSAFEPLLPTKSVTPDPNARILGSVDTLGGDQSASKKTTPLSQEAPAAPPARLSRMSAPQLLRRQRGQGPKEPFKPK